MKKLTLLFIIAMSACGPSKEEMERMAKENGGYKDYEEKTIDGCAYIVYNGALTHKANCNNHITNQ